MATKIIKALVDGVVQNIEVEDLISPELLPSVEERVETLEDKHEVVISEGSMLVGDGTPELKEMTPDEVLSHINGASVVTLTSEEFDALGDNFNANTLYLQTDDNNVDIYTQNDEPTDAADGSLWVDLDAEGSTSGGTSTITGIPHFNLTEMGLPSIESVGNLVSVETDTSDIYVALGKSPVKVSIDFFGKVLTCIVNTTKFDSIDAYQAVVHGDLNGSNLTLIINVWKTKMNAIVYEGSIAGGNYYVTFTDGTEDGDTLTYSHTALEVKNMIDSGCSVIGIYEFSPGFIFLLNIFCVIAAYNFCQITFANCMADVSSEIYSLCVALEDNSSVTNATLVTNITTGLPTGGTVGQLLTINSDGDYVWIDTADVLDKTFVLDKTLTQEGQAADAKAVGDALAEKITTPSTAAVGQTIAVKAIDDNGKPTEWEAVPMPSDGITPVRGTDYWTEEDKAEIKSYVDEAILGGAW